MKLRFLASILIFISAYSPLSVIFLIQDINFDCWTLKNPEIVLPFLGVSLLSCIIIWAAVRCIKVSNPPVTIKSCKNKSGELINYSVPYMVSFFVMDLSNPNALLSFSFFMIITYVITLKTHNLFVNPILAIIGYNVCEITYQKDGRDQQDFVLIKGERLRSQEYCRLAHLSEKLLLVTERIPNND